MKLLKEYFSLEKQIYNYFGYEEQWQVFPLDDNTGCHWMLIGRNYETEHPNCIRYCFAISNEDAKKCMIENEDAGEYYEAQIIMKHIYRQNDYTMICIDTNADGNKFLSIFDNNKEIKQQGE